jgi:hypothetical protein
MWSGTKASLLSGVSVVALIAIQPVIAQAADLPRKAPNLKAIAVPAVSPWTFWVEGGLQGVAGGNPSVPSLTPGFAPAKKTWGWGLAAAVDYRIDPSWHVSAAVRYGANKKRTTSSTQQATVTTGFVFTGGNSASRDESNWVVDFMVGRELGLGTGTSQVKGGLRVAKIKGTTDGAGLLTSAISGYHIRQTYNQTSKFTGFGPRVAIEGNTPLSGPWSLDYMAGVAVLFGKQSIDQTGSNPQLTPTGAFFANNCAVGCAATFSNSASRAVFNTDGMLGIAYAITPNAKLALNYRFDYYASAMRTVDSTGGFSNTYRLYHGPNLRLTWNY